MKTSSRWRKKNFDLVSSCKHFFLFTFFFLVMLKGNVNGAAQFLKNFFFFRSFLRLRDTKPENVLNKGCRKTTKGFFSVKCSGRHLSSSGLL